MEKQSFSWSNIDKTLFRFFGYLLAYQFCERDMYFEALLLIGATHIFGWLLFDLKKWFKKC